MKEECNHEKVYDNEILCSMPPKQKWICRKCKQEGTDTISGLFHDEYSILKNEGKHS